MSQPEVTTTTLAPEEAPPAYFLSLTVENFRCFKERQTLDLSDGNGRPARWTVILGENGVGKTTLLQCLTTMLPVKQLINSILGSALEESFVPILFSLQRNHFISGKPAFFLQGHDNLSPARLGTKYHIGTIASGGAVVSYSISASEHGSLAGEANIPDNVRGLTLFGYSANRKPPLTESESDVGNGWDTLFDTDTRLIDAEQWILEAFYVAVAQSAYQAKARQQLDIIIEMLKVLLPGIKDIKTESIAEIGKRMRVGVFVETDYGLVPFWSLSLGYQTMITWTVDLVAQLFERYPDSPNPLAEPAVVLVDEIDLHLHPKWQRELIRFLSDIFTNTQFIVTAHSPLVVQAAEDANIVVLRREGDHVVIDNNPESVRNWRVDQILASELFGQVPTRSPRIDKKLEERTAILSKATLTEDDERRLQDLNTEIGTLPTAETAEDREAMDIIRRAAVLLQKNGAS